MALATLPIEAVLTIGVVTALTILSCLNIFGAELDQQEKLHKLKVQVNQVQRERQQRLDEMQQQERERSERYSASRQRALNTNSLSVDDGFDVDIVAEAA